MGSDTPALFRRSYRFHDSQTAFVRFHGMLLFWNYSTGIMNGGNLQDSDETVPVDHLSIFICHIVRPDRLVISAPDSVERKWSIIFRCAADEKDIWPNFHIFSISSGDCSEGKRLMEQRFIAFFIISVQFQFGTVV